MREQAINKGNESSIEKKDLKIEYGKNWYGNMSEVYKYKLKEYRKVKFRKFIKRYLKPSLIVIKKDK